MEYRTPEGLRVGIVTCCDQAYFPLAEELVRSIRRFPESAGIPIQILGCGLGDEQKRSAEALGCGVADARWDFPHAWLNDRPVYRRARTVPPFLREYFPDIDLYVWIDADAWVSHWSGVAMTIEAARDGCLSIAPDIDRCYAPVIGGFRARWVFDRPVTPTPSWIYKNSRKILAPKEARRIAFLPALNTGVWGLRADAPHWDRWKVYMKRFLDRRKLVGDQISINIAVYLDDLPVHKLPATCNWLASHCMPMWDDAVGQFVEPFLPHMPIGVIHLASLDAVRDGRRVTAEVPVRGRSGTVTKTLRYQTEERP